MKTKRLAITLGTLAIGAGVFVLPAGAELRQITVTLLGGKKVNVTVDVPAGTPLDQIKLPKLGLPIIAIEEGITGGEQGSPQAPQEGSPEGTGQQKQTTTEKKRNKRAAEREAAQAGERGNRRRQRTKLRGPGGVPTLENPTLSLVDAGPVPVGVPNFMIDRFRIPPFLLGIYQAAGIEYSVPWQLLAAINEIETDYGRNLNVSSAGALGWMQFMPATWKSYGVDANADKRKDPYNPADAIFSAARYLKAAGIETDVRKAIFAYNHADWYVDSVLLRAKLIGGLPADLIGSLTGLTQGHFPVAAKARYADDLSEREAKARAARGENPAKTVDGNSHRRGLRIYSRSGAPVIAVNDGRITKIGENKRLGRFVMLQDVYGNRYTYGHLAKVATRYAVPKRHASRSDIGKRLALPKRDAAPTQPASAGRQTNVAKATTTVRSNKVRLFANPRRPRSFNSGGDQQLLQSGETIGGYTTFRTYVTRALGLRRSDVTLKHLRPGSRVIAGTILGRIGKTSERAASHVYFEIRPAGRGAPRIDPKPILDGWKLLESTAIYRAAGRNPFVGRDARNPTIGQIMLMSKEQLERQVLHNSRIDIYSCGRRDIKAGIVDRRVLATLEFLAASGFRPTATSLRCGHTYLTKSGNVSEHSSGNAVDIAKINGIPIMGNQGKGSITDLVVQRLLTLQGVMRPHQIITLMKYKGTANTFAMTDHDDHVHIGWRPLFGSNKKLGRQLNAILKPGQWIKLIDRISEIDNPSVPTRPSKYSLDVKRVLRSSGAHRGE